jgi:putative autotransporter adhesin-like protein
VRKVGIIIFVIALAIGVVLANMSSFGRLGGRIFNVSVNFGAEKGSGNIVTESRDVAGFSSLDVSGVFKVEAVAQKDFALTVEADDNLLPFIKTEVRNGTLYIESDKRLKSRSAITIKVAAPDLENVRTSGAATVAVSGLANDHFDLDTSGASKISLQGSTNELKVDVSGASQIDGGSLVSEKATVDASGACTVNVNAANELNVDASGASKIFYTGNAKVNKSTSGASSVTQK